MNPLQPDKRYLFPDDYMADPSVHVYNGKIYIYPPTTGNVKTSKTTTATNTS